MTEETKELTQAELKRHGHAIKRGWDKIECNTDGCKNTLYDIHVFKPKCEDECSFDAVTPATETVAPAETENE